MKPYKMENFRDILKNRFIQSLIDKTWKEVLKEFYGPTSKVDIIWILVDLVKKGEFIEEAVQIARLYVEDENPAKDYDQLNERIEKGEEIRGIYTVRGTLSWLLQAITASLRTEYYPEVIGMLEKLIKDPVYYVRIHALSALSSFAVNIKATKNKDGSIFDFKEEDRSKVYELAFNALIENKKLPRILEGAIGVFDKLRFIEELKAKEVLAIFFYNEKEEFNPEYLIENMAPLAMFFAEFRNIYTSEFNNKWFQDFLEKIIKKAVAEKKNQLINVLIWNTWRAIKEKNTHYELLKKYIPLYFEKEVLFASTGQMEFLAKAVLKANPSDGIDLYEKLLKYINDASKEPYNFQFWLVNTEEIIKQIREIDPSRLPNILNLLQRLKTKGYYIDDGKNILFSNDEEIK